MNSGAFTVRTYPLDLIRIDCRKCGRAGQYHRATLLDRFGPDRAMPDVLGLLTECPRRENASDNCMARYPDLATFKHIMPGQ